MRNIVLYPWPIPEKYTYCDHLDSLEIKKEEDINKQMKGFKEKLIIAFENNHKEAIKKQ